MSHYANPTLHIEIRGSEGPSHTLECPRCGHTVKWFLARGMRTLMDGCGHLAQVEERDGAVVFCFHRGGHATN